MTQQNKSLTGNFYTDELGRRVLRIKKRVVNFVKHEVDIAERAAKAVIKGAEHLGEEALEVADAGVHIVIDAVHTTETLAIHLAKEVGKDIEKGAEAVAETADAAVHVVIDVTKDAVDALKTAGHAVIEFGAMVIVKADDMIIAGVKFADKELHALSRALEMDMKELVHFLAYLPEKTLKALRDLDQRAIKLVRHIRQRVRHIERELPMDVRLAKNALKEMFSKNAFIECDANKHAEAIIGYYLNGLMPFKFEGYRKSSNSFVVKVESKNDAELLNGIFMPLTSEGTHFFFEGAQ